MLFAYTYLVLKYAKMWDVNDLHVQPNLGLRPLYTLVDVFGTGELWY